MDGDRLTETKQKTENRIRWIEMWTTKLQTATIRGNWSGLHKGYLQLCHLEAVPTIWAVNSTHNFPQQANCHPFVEVGRIPVTVMQPTTASTYCSIPFMMLTIPYMFTVSQGGSLIICSGSKPSLSGHSDSLASFLTPASITMPWWWHPWIWAVFYWKLTHPS